MDFFSGYALFAAETATIAGGIGLVLYSMSSGGNKKDSKGSLSLSLYKDISDQSQNSFSELGCNEIRQTKQKKKKNIIPPRRLYVISFDGDAQCSQIDSLREEISAIINDCRPGDEALVIITSGGGEVSAYGLAASQLERLRNANIDLTVCVDRVAASGGYLMACVANRIISAPYATIGSIGVVVQMPNIHKLLSNHNIDVEMITSGEHKRTLTLLGENTEDGRTKVEEDLKAIHNQFKQTIKKYRSDLDIDEIGTGETWLGDQALEKGLVDRIGTSDEEIQNKVNDFQVIQVSWDKPKSFSSKLTGMAAQTLTGAHLKLAELSGKRYFQ